MTSRTPVTLLSMLVLPLLLAPKCFDPPPEQPVGMIDAGASTDGGPGPGDDGAPGDDAEPIPVFTPAVACPQSGQARLYIVDSSYQVQCGCRQASGKVCNVPRGTRVIWQFADSEEHNVASEGNGFTPSGERLTGTYSLTFDRAGRYGYGCTIHTEMNGYAIVVE